MCAVKIDVDESAARRAERGFERGRAESLAQVNLAKRDLDTKTSGSVVGRMSERKMAEG